jgi:hypothetical protein
MKLSEIKSILTTVEAVNFQLENGAKVPEHFHVTEVGMVSKHFIDCGGKTREESKANFQLWDANDFEHRLKPQKLLNIISLCEKKLGMQDTEIEVEYQSETIGKYGLEFNGRDFILTAMKTACLAKEACGVPAQELSANEAACCTTAGGCR